MAKTRRRTFSERSAAVAKSTGRIGAILGLSWGPLGPSRGHLEASRAHHRMRKGKEANKH
eukprot:6841833-Pyramimonas_sp.AAC.1